MPDLDIFEQKDFVTKLKTMEELSLDDEITHQQTISPRHAQAAILQDDSGQADGGLARRVAGRRTRQRTPPHISRPKSPSPKRKSAKKMPSPIHPRRNPASRSPMVRSGARLGDHSQNGWKHSLRRRPHLSRKPFITTQGLYS